MVRRKIPLVGLVLLIMLWFSGQKVMGQCYKMELRPFRQNGKYGAIAIKTGKVVIKPKFALADSFPGNYLLVSKTNKKTKPAFRWVKPIWDSREPQQSGLVNEKGKLVLPMKYQNITAVDCEHFLVSSGNRHQLLDKNFNVLYEDTTWFYPNIQANRIFSKRTLNDTLSEFTIKDLKTGKVYFQTKAKNGKPIANYYKSENIPKRRILPFFEITTLNRKNKKAIPFKSIIDINGNVIFDSLLSLQVSEGYAWLNRNIQGKQVYLTADTNFQIIPTLSYKEEFPRIENSRKGWFSFQENGKRGVVNLKGKIVMPFTDKGRYTYIGKNAFHFAEYGTQNQRILFINGQNTDLSKYDLTDFKDTLLLNRPFVLQNLKTNKFCLMDMTGKLIFPEIYNSLTYVSSSLLFYTIDSEFGFLTTAGKTKKLGNYVAMAPFNEGLKLIYLNNPDSTIYKVAFIDTTGTFLPGFYKNASSFYGGFARVIQNEDTFMIDKKGQQISFGKYPLYSHFYKGVAVVSNKEHTRFGIVNRSGKILVKPKYAKINIVDNDSDCTYHFLISTESNLNVLPVLTPNLVNGNIQVSKKRKKPELIKLREFQ